jgi:hypothetical protein
MTKPRLTPWLALAAAFIGMPAHTAPKRQHALDCANHYERGFCEREAAEKAEAAMRESYEHAIWAAQTFWDDQHKNPLIKGYIDWKSWIEKNQRLWEAWSKDECPLEGNITMGSAEITDTPACQERLARQRIEMLDGFSAELGYQRDTGH